MSQIHLLYQLQQIDDQLRRGKRRLQEVLTALQGSESLLAAQRRKEAGAAQLQEVRQEQKELELELGSLNAKTQRSEQRLYSGQVTNPKELGDLQQEVSSLKRRRGALEDELLEAMMATEEAETEETAASKHLAAEEEAWQENQSELSAERDRLRAELSEQLEQREKLVARLDGKLMAAYDSTSKRRGGLAVVGMQDELCQGCGVRASGSKVRAVRGGELIYCGSCGRIMVPV